MNKIIIITGTPGTGKTYLANKLSLLLKKEVINISIFAKKHKLFEKYDKKMDTYDICEKRLIKKLKEEIKTKKEIIIEGHMSQYLPKTKVDLCIVCKTELKELKKRLEKRKYPLAKIKENLECEIFDICLNEAIEKKHKVKVIDCTKLNEKKIERIMSEINSAL
jgi:adenylate kinase